MVGVVVISHSPRAAKGIRDIAVEMGSSDTRLVVAGGDVDGGIGTDPNAIAEAITEAAGVNDDHRSDENKTANDNPTQGEIDDVVLLVDLGSAVMNAELAIEMVTIDNTVHIADAPVLEGALNATVEASSSKATVESVIAAAEDAREYSKIN
ncbi:PTS-dependent dihydroxyacetone kinase phosphotransferase subunit DhaM [Haloquadratum walsbyi]|uniref:Probable phosphoenolpyruvate-protein phosphoryltransferase n=1 Tax=Haloquadratum walsbyi (strain DSM 16790 / HBSQ001) TaxID=362976 RepID=Q18GW0_HALWD|nr:PTS mannose transporter subunit IID [Haloquadratum walsbyi]CAJ52785.1 probable phosphoenolpyruvate-protein phosphoryltransferase [Haloquadratum walsbyi DSM 16790]